MFSSPLAFFEVQNLSPEFARDAARAIHAWKACRDRIFGGAIFPIGAQPDGVAWTGFASVADDGGSAIVLVFRERHPDACADFDIPFLRGQRFDCQTLAGDGSCRMEDGRFRATIDHPLRFLLAGLTLAKEENMSYLAEAHTLLDGR